VLRGVEISRPSPPSPYRLCFYLPACSTRFRFLAWFSLFRVNLRFFLYLVCLRYDDAHSEIATVPSVSLGIVFFPTTRSNLPLRVKNSTFGYAAPTAPRRGDGAWPRNRTRVAGARPGASEAATPLRSYAWGLTAPCVLCTFRLLHFSHRPCGFARDMIFFLFSPPLFFCSEKHFRVRLHFSPDGATTTTLLSNRMILSTTRIFWMATHAALRCHGHLHSLRSSPTPAIDPSSLSPFFFSRRLPPPPRECGDIERQDI